MAYKKKYPFFLGGKYENATRLEISATLPFGSIAVNLRYPQVVFTLHLCVLYGSQNKQQLLPYTGLTDWFL
jgi:hypothetical protein